MKSEEKSVVIEYGGCKIMCEGNYTPEYNTGNRLDPPDPAEFEITSMEIMDGNLIDLMCHIDNENYDYHKRGYKFELLRELTTYCLDEIE